MNNNCMIEIILIENNNADVKTTLVKLRKDNAIKMLHLQEPWDGFEVGQYFKMSNTSNPNQKLYLRVSQVHKFFGNGGKGELIKIQYGVNLIEVFS